jgi:hypothetical protein
MVCPVHVDEMGTLLAVAHVFDEEAARELRDLVL